MTPFPPFVISQNMALVLDLVGEIMMSQSRSFSTMSFKIEGEKLTLDTSTLLAYPDTITCENLALT